jgi:hypothetical protein
VRRSAIVRRLFRMRAAERLIAVAMVGIIASGAGLIGHGVWLKLADPQSVSPPTAAVALEDSASVSDGRPPPGDTKVQVGPTGRTAPAAPLL